MKIADRFEGEIHHVMYEVNDIPLGATSLEEAAR
jgi:hypothetical protein